MRTYNFENANDTTESRHGLGFNGDRLIFPFRTATAKRQSGNRKPLLAMMMGISLLLLTFAFSCIPRSSGDPMATLTTADFHSLAFHPQDPNTVFFGHHNGVLKSVDGGRTWQETSFRGRNWDAMGMAISPVEPQQMYVAGHDIFFGSNDGGKSWAPIRHDLPGTDIHGVAMDPDNPSKLYAFVVGYGLYSSNNAGSNWQFISSGLPGDVMVLASAGDQIQYAGSMERGVLKSSDGGKTWVPVNTGIEGRNVMGLAVNPYQRQTVYVGTARGIFQSTDGASSWKKLAFPGENAVVVAAAYSNPQVVMAISVGNDRKGYVYRSEDGGQTWVGRPETPKNRQSTKGLSQVSKLPVYFELPSFSLTDQSGRTVGLPNLRGKVLVANFIFTNCTSFCPTVLSPRMQELQDRLLNEGLLGDRVMLLSFSVDPEQDTSKKLWAYAQKYGADPDRWLFLTGFVAEIEKVVTQGLKLGLQKIEQPVEHQHPDGTVHIHKYDVIHSNSFVLLDKQGRARAYYNAVYDWKMDKVLDDIRQLLGRSE